MLVVVMVVMVVIVVVIMSIKRKGAPRARPEQFAIGGRSRDHIGRAFVADVPVQTDHAISRGHHNV